MRAVEEECLECLTVVEMEVERARAEIQQEQEEMKRVWGLYMESMTQVQQWDYS